MAHVLGLDIGTTTVSGVVVDTADGRQIARAGHAHHADVALASADQADWAEQDPAKLWQAACDVLAELTGSADADISAIGLTGQMHGLILVDADNDPVGNLITWQDGRTAGMIDALLASATDQAWSVTGCRLAAGYMAATLAWLTRHDALPASARRVCFIHDWVAARLAGTEPCTDPSDAASAGIFDLRAKTWSPELTSDLDLPEHLLPSVRESGDVIGHLPAKLAGTIGLRPGIPVCNAIGDNQASYLGSVADPDRTILINIGTGGQISWIVDDVSRAPGMEVRYLPIDRLFAVGAGTCGGRTYAWLAGVYRQILAALAGREPDDESLYDKMNALAAAAPADASGLRFRPTLTGTRLEPQLRGELTNIDLSNLTPANLTRAVLTGVVDELLAFYETCDPARRSSHTRVVGSGNALRRNRVLCQILSERLGMPVKIPVHLEEAAHGAALLAAVAVGALSDLLAAGNLIQYETVD